MEELEKQYRALANRRRLTILKFLKRRRQASVKEIAKEIKLKFKATSRHLRILFTVGALEKDQQGLSVYYRLADKPLSVFGHLIKNHL